MQKGRDAGTEVGRPTKRLLQRDAGAWTRGGSGDGEKWLDSGYTGNIDINVNNMKITLVHRGQRFLVKVRRAA